MKPKAENKIYAIDVTNVHHPQSYFEDGSPVQFKINVDGTPTINIHTDRPLFYGEVTYFNPASKSWVIIWFSHNYTSPTEAFEDCYKHEKQFIKDNPTIAC